MAKKKQASAPKPRTLQGLLKIEETTTKFSVLKQRLAEGELPDGKAYSIWADLVNWTVSLERVGQPTRVVHLKDLIATMFYAEERS